MDGPWKVYFRINDQPIEETVKFLQSTIKNKSLWYFHPNGAQAGPHIHGILWDHDQTAETLRNKIKKFFHLDNKTHYGISNKYDRGQVMTEDSSHVYISYMTKGQFDPVYNVNYDDQYVNERKREWKQPTTIRISGDLEVITTGEVKKTRITQYSIAREAEEQYMEEEDPVKMAEEGLKLRKLERIVVNLFNKYKMKIPAKTCADVISDICARLAPNYYHSQVKRFLGLTPGVKIY